MIKRLVIGSLLVFTLLLASACVHPPTPHIKGDRPLMPPPPPLFFPAPPMLGFLHGYDVYVVVNVSEDVVFYQGAWYRMHNREWHRGSAHNGPWHKVPPGHIPKSLRGLPYNMKGQVKGQENYRHHDVERNWRQWDKERKDKSKDKSKDKKQDRMKQDKDENKRKLQGEDKRYERNDKQQNRKDKRSKKKQRNKGDDDEGKKGGKGKGRRK